MEDDDTRVRTLEQKAGRGRLGVLTSMRIIWTMTWPDLKDTLYLTRLPI